MYMNPFYSVTPNRSNVTCTIHVSRRTPRHLCLPGTRDFYRPRGLVLYYDVLYDEIFAFTGHCLLILTKPFGELTGTHEDKDLTGS